MLEIMKKKGFGDKCILWMEMIFSYGTSLVLLNGTPGIVFHCKRGVIQGILFPLSFLC